MPGLNLTHKEAEQRSTLVSVTHYDVALDLNQGVEDFRSRTTITFDAQAGESTFVDLVSNYIHSINLNGVEIGSSAHDNHRITLNGLAEHNILTVDANCQYMHTGEGLHRFIDPADNEAYCYSQFEVPDARRVYATFEQPDLKATFTFTVTVPQGWKVFSNSPTPEPSKDGNQWVYSFAETEKISTYITAIVAGPYKGITDSLISSDGRTIDLGLWCRASLLEHLDADSIIDTTKKGFTFFEAQYGIPYPFTKYDQIFVPEYNAGAMENAGCVTFRDQYIFRSHPTAEQLETRANTILHELAHMWFGDLVTMKWWNDLWLNESFAEYMSHLALAEGTEWKEAWTGFMLRKDWGMRQDQMPTTHPIKAEIHDLADVEVNFDGITYAKGASVLRQLVAYVGRAPFFKGLHEYLTKHSYANATLDDLLSELQIASGKDLSFWSRVWLEEAGVTLLRPVIDSAPDGTIEKLKITQTPFTPGSSNRPQHLGIAGYRLNEDGIVSQVFCEELDLEDADVIVPAAAGKMHPGLILINDGDLAYAKIRLDDNSLNFAKKNITKFTDSLARNIILACVWDMVRDAEISVHDYLKIVLQAISVEENMSMLSLALRHINESVNTFASPTQRPGLQSHVADELLFLTQVAPSGSDRQRILLKAFAQYATTDKQLATLKRFYLGTEPLTGLDIDIDLSWDLLIALVSSKRAGMKEIAEKAAEDTTITGKQNQARARASRPDFATKTATWDAIIKDSSIPNDTRWAMAAGFWAQVYSDPQLYTSFVDAYFNSLESMWANNTFHTAEDLVLSLFPSGIAGYVSGPNAAEKAQEWILLHPEASPALVRLLKERISIVKRMLAAQEASK